MANKSIKGRYTIEYVYPDSSPKEEVSNKKWPIILACVLLVGALSSFVVPFKSIESFVASTVNRTTIHKQNYQKSASEEEGPEELIEVAEDQSEVIEKEELSDVLNNLDSDFLVGDVNRVAPEVEVSAAEEVIDVVEIDVEKILLDNIKHQELSRERLHENEELTKTINDLKRQLETEKDKNEKLSDLINTDGNSKRKITPLLNEPLDSVSNEDQKPVVELNDLDSTENIPKPTIETKELTSITNNSESSKDATVSSEVAKTILSTTPLAKVSSNSISNSTGKKIDAIVLAMQELQQGNAKPGKSIAKETVAIMETVVDKEKIETVDKSLHVKLDNQINDLFEPNQKKSSSNSNSEKKLKNESRIRNNAIRSIIVEKGETLWSIAKRAYGNGSLYKKIIKANPHIEKDGKITISAGQVLRVPI